MDAADAFIGQRAGVAPFVAGGRLQRVHAEKTANLFPRQALIRIAFDLDAAVDGFQQIGIGTKLGPGEIEEFGDRQAVFEAEVRRTCFIDDESNTHQKIVADAFADRFVHHEPKTSPILD